MECTGDATRGAELYVKQCEYCYTIEKGGAHVFGPNLYDIFGQVSVQIPGSKPSQIYKDKAITWPSGTMV
jgi:cytochrome c